MRNDMPNQDAISWHPQISLTQLPVIMAVADGHGGAKYFRSDKGAAFAVTEALSVVQEFLSGHENTENLSIVKTSAEEWLPKAIIRAWTERVREHISTNSFTEEEQAKHSANGLSNKDSHLVYAYGTTLLVAVVAKDFLLFLQLGDGDILTVYDEGEIERPIFSDERLMGNETTSLCGTDAWRDFRTSFQPNAGNYPSLIFLSTDGYSNSFRNDEGFKKVAADIWRILKTGDVETVENNLEDWLNEASRAGSGDDITAGILFRQDAIEPMIEETAGELRIIEARSDTDSQKPEFDINADDPLEI